MSASYPNSVKSFAANQDNVTVVDASYTNQRDQEIVALEAELGTLPKGSYADVKTRLNALGVKVATASIAFTDGDTLRRATVTDVTVLSTDRIVCTVRRPDTVDDSADAGYLYIVNVVRITNGSFDVLIAALGWGFDDPVLYPPNETIALNYFIQR